MAGLFLSLFAVVFVVFGIGLPHALAAQDRTASDTSPSTFEEEEGRDEHNAWRFWGGNIHNTHSSSSERHLKARNVGRLAVKWAFTTGGDVSATPTVEGNAVYVPDWAGNLFKIDADTGTAIWRKKISDYTGNPQSFTRNSPAIAGDKIVFGDQRSGTVIAVDKSTGNLVWKTLVEPHPAARVTNSPVVFDGRVYVGMSSGEEVFALVPGYHLTFRGSVNALDLKTGAILWTTSTVPDGYTGGAVWGSNFAVDAKRRSLYVTTGNNYSVPNSVSACLKAATTVAAELACLSPVDYIDSVLSLSLDDGHVKWGRRLEGSDTWIISCYINPGAGIPCPDPAGPDYDFGSGPNFFQIGGGHDRVDIVGAGQKSGTYWALNAQNGDILWATQVGPGGLFGGIQWGSATDGRRIYVAIGNSGHVPYTLAPSHTVTVTGGSWAALDPVTGNILWQIPASGQDPLHPPFPAIAIGQVSAANGVVYAGSMSGDMVAMSAKSGEILWKFASGGSVASGPSIVDGTVYWGSGYTSLGSGTTNDKIYAFTVGSDDF